MHKHSYTHTYTHAHRGPERGSTDFCAWGEGDCDYDSDCFGSLTCSHNNCPWDYNDSGDSRDDCCY